MSGRISCAGALGVCLEGVSVAPAFRLHGCNLTKCDLRGVAVGGIRNCLLVDCDLPPWLLPGSEGITRAGRGLHDAIHGNFIKEARS